LAGSLSGQQRSSGGGRDFVRVTGSVGSHTGWGRNRTVASHATSQGEEPFCGFAGRGLRSRGPVPGFPEGDHYARARFSLLRAEPNPRSPQRIGTCGAAPHVDEPIAGPDDADRSANAGPGRAERALNDGRFAGSSARGGSANAQRSQVASQHSSSGRPSPLSCASGKCDGALGGQHSACAGDDRPASEAWVRQNERCGSGIYCGSKRLGACGNLVFGHHRSPGSDRRQTVDLPGRVRYPGSATTFPGRPWKRGRWRGHHGPNRRGAIFSASVEEARRAACLGCAWYLYSFSRGS